MQSLEEEACFLALHFLAPRLGREAVALLEHELTSNGSLPRRTDYRGLEHPQSLSELQRCNSHIPSDALPQLLGQLLTSRQQDGQPGAQWLATVLGAGSLSLLPTQASGAHSNAPSGEGTLPNPGSSSQAARITLNLRQPPSQNTNATSSLVGPEQLLPEPKQPAGSTSGLPSLQPDSSLPYLKAACDDAHVWRRILPWLTPPHTAANLQQAVLLRQLHGKAAGASRLRSPALSVGRLRHARTFRGHRMAVYCLEFSRDGSHLITGSDDWLVKIWSTETGCLLRTCRGHEAEITDLALSTDGCLMASASNDTVIRVWNMQAASLGFPVAVLVGHQAAVTSLDFHPTLNLLASSSDDGTCRVWNASDDSVQPLVLNPGPDFGAAPTTSDLGHSGASRAPDIATTSADLTAASQHDALQQKQQGADGNTASTVASNPATTSQQAAQGPRPSGTGAGRTRASAGLAQPPAAPPPIQAPVDPPAVVPAIQAAPVGEDDSAGPARPQNGVEFSRDGRYIISAGGDGNVYVWHWDLTSAAAAPVMCLSDVHVLHSSSLAEPSLTAASQPVAQQMRCRSTTGLEGGPGSRPSPGVQGDAAVTLDDVLRGQWPEAREAAKLVGHTCDITILKFAHGGHAFATVSKDGTVHVWRESRDTSPGGGPGWYSALEVACTLDEADLAALRQRRRPAHPPSVNQLAWNADDTMVVLVATDNSVRVWDTARGLLRHTIKEAHTEQAVVVECHPRDPSVAMTAGYDGRCVIWDVLHGHQLASFSTQDTMPLAGARWTDPLQVVDGKWMPDGLGLVLGDTAGQFHLYLVGNLSPALRRWPYDQFWSSDYAQCTRDLNQWVVDQEHQVPPHMVPQTLWDRMETPYDSEVQVAARTGCSSHLPVQARHELPQGLVILPPTVTCAIWQAQSRGQSEATMQGASDRAMERHRNALQAYLMHEAAAAGAARGHPQLLSGAGAPHPTAAYLQGGRPAWSDDEPISVPSSPASGHTSPSVHLTDDDSDADPDSNYSSEVESESDEEQDSRGVAVRLTREGVRRSGRAAAVGNAPRRSGRAANGEGRAGERASRRAAQRPGRRRQSQRLGSKRARSRYQEPSSEASDLFSSGSSDDDEGDGDGGGSDGSDSEPGRRRRRRATRQQKKPKRQKRSATATDDDADGGGDDDDDDGSGSEPGRRKRPGRRQQQRPGRGAALVTTEAGSRRSSRRRRVQVPSQELEDEEEVEVEEAQAKEEEEEVGEQPRDQEGQQGQRDQEEGDQVAVPPRSSKPAKPPRASGSRQRSNPTEMRARPLHAYQWLLRADPDPSCFVPQVGDEVVYLRTGHQVYLDGVQDVHTSRPWVELEEAAEHAAVANDCAELGAWRMRPAEPCQVLAIDYLIAQDGTSATLPRLMLQLLDCPANLPQRSFEVVVPSPDAGHADFLVLRTRYEAAVRKSWAVGDMLKTYQIDESGGQWWEAVVVKDVCIDGEAGVDRVDAAPGPSRPRRHAGGATAHRSGDGAEPSRPLRHLGGAELANGAGSSRARRHVNGTDGGADEDNGGAGPSRPRRQQAGPAPPVRGVAALHTALLPLLLHVNVYSLPCQWERYGVSWGTTRRTRGAPADQWLSPWEMWDSQSSWGLITAGDPSLTQHEVDSALAAVRAVLPRGLYHCEDYDLFEEAPRPENVFEAQHPDCGGRAVRYNARVALPLGLRDLERRLASRYYRQLAAFRSDLEVLVSNAGWFNGLDADMHTIAQQLQATVLQMLEGQVGNGLQQS